MTHTLHRFGNREDLTDDYVCIILPAKGINDEGSDRKLQQYLCIGLRHHPNNIGSDSQSAGGWYTHTTDEIIAMCHGEAHVVFSSKADAIDFLREVKNSELDLSVVMSGLLDEVEDICKQVGITRHTVNYSLGFRGRLDKLPPPDVLEITTMCGHHMVPPILVTKMVEDIKDGKRTAEDCAKLLARPCVCGCFNVVRAERLLRKMAAKA